MNTITIIDREKLIKINAATSGQRKVVTAALLACAADSKSNSVSYGAVSKLTVAEIDKRGSVQGGEYVTRYYVSELKNRFGCIDHDGKSGGRGGNLSAFEVKR